MIIPHFLLTLVFRPHRQRIISMVYHRITSRDRHPHRSQFGRPGPNRSDRSPRPVGPVPQTGQTVAMVLGSVSQPQVAPLPTSADYSLEREMADSVPPIRRSHMLNPLFLHRYPRMFGMIGLGLIRNIPHKRCPLLILRHIVSAKHPQITMRLILLG